MLQRVVQSEWLDSLPPTERGAMGSRRDLHLLNRLMGHTGSFKRLAARLTEGQRPASIVDLGAGDGQFALHLARGLAPRWPGATLTLVDAHALVAPGIRKQLEHCGWRVNVDKADVMDWLRRAPVAERELHLCNLFLHHFDGIGLRQLLEQVAARASWLVALEPRRSLLALACSRLLRWLGCNHVTRHDAPVSVRAGFLDQELSALWPKETCWELSEGPTGLFSHSFAARRLPRPT